MKRLICTTLIPNILALSLMGATAASAQSYRGGHGGFGQGGYSHGGGWHGADGALRVWASACSPWAPLRRHRIATATMTARTTALRAAPGLICPRLLCPLRGL